LLAALVGQVQLLDLLARPVQAPVRNTMPERGAMNARLAGAATRRAVTPAA
jgi:hypothetical protein